MGHQKQGRPHRPRTKGGVGASSNQAWHVNLTGPPACMPPSWEISPEHRLAQSWWRVQQESLLSDLTCQLRDQYAAEGDVQKPASGCQKTLCLPAAMAGAEMAARDQGSRGTCQMPVAIGPLDPNSLALLCTSGAMQGSWGSLEELRGHCRHIQTLRPYIAMLDQTYGDPSRSHSGVPLILALS
uniref:Uncharacterized protein n=1 Tax=Sphaerodactylus townsendi TaxID=933632 RepID=A0ACB8GAJ5_9SAUR